MTGMLLGFHSVSIILGWEVGKTVGRWGISSVGKITIYLVSANLLGNVAACPLSWRAAPL